MTPRGYEFLACGLAIGLVGAQLLIKPDLETSEARATAERARRSRQWQTRTAPGFELPLRDGRTFRLSDETGRRIVVLIFFTTSSESCRRELPELHRYVERLQHSGKPILALAINGQERADLVDQYANSLNVTLPIAIDDTGSVTRAYEVGRFPTTVVMGADGRVAFYLPDEIPNPAVAFDALLETEFAALTRIVRMKLP